MGCRGAKACDPIDRFRWTSRNIRFSDCAKPFRGYVQALKRTPLHTHILSFIVHNFSEPYENVHFPSRVLVPATCYTTTAVNTFTKTFFTKVYLYKLAEKTFSWGNLCFRSFHIFLALCVCIAGLVWQKTNREKNSLRMCTHMYLYKNHRRVLYCVWIRNLYWLHSSSSIRIEYIHIYIYTYIYIRYTRRDDVVM